MRRFLTLVCLLGLALPAGISISGCVRNPAGNYCNGLGYGPTISQVYSLTLQPQIAGISLAYGQTTGVSQPRAFNCKGDGASYSLGSLVYGTTNNQLVDISPSGLICAGTWNRNTGGGIADYTYCSPPNPLPSTGGLPYAIAYVTAAANSVTSNPVTVYVHAPISSISLVTTPLSGAPAQGCYSQNQQAQLDADAYYSLNGVQTLLCAPGSAAVPECSNSIGTLSFVTGTTSVATIDATTNIITAHQPGTTVITATIAQSASSAGYFSTCPPKSISIAFANGSTNRVITQGVAQNLTTTVTDTQGNPITGLALNYESTNPIDLTATGTGSVTPLFPGVATVTAVCEPPACNPAPINELGLNGTGLPITSNPVGVIVPGATSDFAWFAAPGQSQYIYSIELLTGTPGSTVRLPYVPNSMVMDQAGQNLYLGSPRELMIYSTQSNSITKQDMAAPGVVLAASPNGRNLIINDPIRGVLYLYSTLGGVSSTFGGLGAAAAWTPDSNTVYIVDSAALGGNHTNTLYVYNTNSGWSSYDLSASGGAQSLAITVPGIGAYLSGDPTVAHTWCPSGTVGNNASILFYPQPGTDSINIATSLLGATDDGDHILGASLNGTSITLDDIGVNIPPSLQYPEAECPETTAGATQTLAPLSTNPSLNGTVNLSQVTDATGINQIVTGAAPTTASTTTAAPIAFITYSAPSNSTTAAQLPFYLPQPTPGVAGPVGYVSFADASSATPPTAPLVGAFSPDNSIFFVSTAGDDEIHFVSIPANLSPSSPPTDTQQISPNLPACTPVSAGGTDAGCLYPVAPGPNTVVPATAIAVKPRSVT